MLKHYIMLRYYEHVSDEHIHAFCSRAGALTESIAAIVSMTVGKNEIKTARNWDIILDMTFDSENALRDYQSHPEHLALLAFNNEKVEDVAVVDFHI